MKKLLYGVLFILPFCFFALSANGAVDKTDKTLVLDGVTFTHKTVVVNGISLHYVTGGQGEPVLLLHGYPETWYAWRKVMPALSRKYTVIAPDMRGLGDSSRPDNEDYTKKSVAGDMYKLVQSLGYKQISLIAQDMGGPVAASFAGMHPEAVRKMVIIDTLIPGYGLEAAMDTAHGGSWHFGLFADRETALLLTKGREKEFFTQWAFRGKYVVDKATFTDTDIREYVRHYAAPGGMAAGFGYYQAFAQDAKDNAALFAQAKITCPILAVGGESGIGEGTLKSMKNLSTNVRGVIVKNCGHFVNEESPAELSRIAIEFLTEP